MTSKKYKINNEQELQKLAEKIAPKLKIGDVVTLVGTLGAGKTSFARAIINSLADENTEVPSPTFTLVQTYDLPKISIWHFDLYRLEENRNDIIELGWEDARRYGSILVEWPDRLGKLLPKEHIQIKIDFLEESETARIVTIDNIL